MAESLGSDWSKSVVYSSPLGPLKLTASEEGVTAVKYLFGKHAERTAAAQQAPEEDGLKWSERLEDDKSDAVGHLRVCCEWLDAYFAGKLLSPDPPPRPKLALSKKGFFSQLALSLMLTFKLSCFRWLFPYSVVCAVKYQRRRDSKLQGVSRLVREPQSLSCGWPGSQKPLYSHSGAMPQGGQQWCRGQGE